MNTQNLILADGVAYKLVPVEPTLEILPQGTQPDHIAQDRKIPTDTEMLNWMIENEAVVSFLRRSKSYEVWFRGVCVETGKTEREAISKAMRGEK